MRPSGLRLFAKKGHSAGWLQRHIKDRYVQWAQEHMYRSRAAYKLRQLDGKYTIFKQKTTVVDLGCYAGGWSQVAIERTGARKGKRHSMVVGVDKVQMDPLDYHEFVLGDVRDNTTLKKVEQILGSRKAHVVLADMAPDMTGRRIDDHMGFMELCRAAFRFAEAILTDGGWFITKAFNGALLDEYRAQLQDRFRQVIMTKPKACRKESKEIYFVCCRFRGGMPGDTDSRELSSDEHDPERGSIPWPVGREVKALHQLQQQQKGPEAKAEDTNT